MSLRFWVVPALALLALAAAATTGAAKPPDLPEELKITVDARPGPVGLFLNIHPFKVLPDVEFPTEQPPETPSTNPPSVLQGLDQLIQAGDVLEQAQTHARAGRNTQALLGVIRVCELAPGSTVSRKCEEVLNQVSQNLTCEHHCRSAESCCSTVRQLRRLNQMGWCWFNFLGEHCVSVAKAKQAARCKCGPQCCPASCDKCPCDTARTRQGKDVMVDGLLKAAHLAIGAGQSAKAGELVRQAHALDAQRVEADPLVYKLHLLPAQATASAPPRRLPDHPLQKRQDTPPTFIHWLFGSK